MGRDKDCHTLIARQVDQQFPKPVTRERIYSRGRLVEDQHLGLMDDCHGEREPLADAERQIEGAVVDMICKAETVDQFGNSCFSLAHRQVEQARVKIEVLPNSQLGVEGERLRHIADAIARLQVARIERTAEKQRFALAGRQ
jgi:hypothetical protein